MQVTGQRLECVDDLTTARGVTDRIGREHEREEHERHDLRRVRLRARHADLGTYAQALASYCLDSESYIDWRTYTTMLLNVRQGKR